MLILAIGIFYLRPFDHLARWGKTQNHPPQMSNSFSGAADRAFLPAADNGSGQPNTVQPADFNKNKSRRPKVDIISVTLFFLVIALSITILIVKRWKLALEQAARAETDKVNAELSFLKAQIDPHFLFNTLNNIYSLAVMKDDNTAESIMKLSNIMRYVTDEAKDNFVSLRNETNFISNYIELQRLRLGSKVTLDFAVSGNLRDKLIAPLILITFIENVFKYGISNSEPSTIKIDLKADNNTINFFCRNKMYPLKQHTDLTEGTGIGILNATKRLDYLYTGKYHLDIKKDDGYYSVNLILQT